MKRTHQDELEYFASPGLTTDLGRHVRLVSTLPSDPNALGKVVRGVIIHNWMAAIRGIESTPERDAMQITGAAPLIERILEIDSDPIDVKRPAERRTIGFCYHFAVLQCALLRAKNVAARTRCGSRATSTKGSGSITGSLSTGIGIAGTFTIRRSAGQPHPAVDAELDTYADLASRGGALSELR